MQENSASTEAFKARNGMTVREGDDGSLKIGNVDGYLSQAAAYAADEYFQAKHDEDLMRWRDPLEPDRVVSRMIGGGIHVYDERGLTYSVFTRPAFGGHAVRTSVGDFGFTATADRFFEAHPEPKPWESAKHGEVWALTVDGAETAFYPSKSLDRAFTPVAPGTGRTAVAMNSPEISDGRCIWPEDAS